jgi:hypothetical protein
VAVGHKDSSVKPTLIVTPEVNNLFECLEITPVNQVCDLESEASAHATKKVDDLFTFRGNHRDIFVAPLAENPLTRSPMVRPSQPKSAPKLLQRN